MYYDRHKLRLPFFYGWVIVAVLSLASMIGMAMGGLSFGLFIKHSSRSPSRPRVVSVSDSVSAR